MTNLRDTKYLLKKINYFKNIRKNISQISLIVILIEKKLQSLYDARETARLFCWLKSTEIECERHQKNKSSNNMDHSRVGGKSPYGGDTYATILTTTFIRMETSSRASFKKSTSRVSDLALRG